MKLSEYCQRDTHSSDILMPSNIKILLIRYAFLISFFFQLLTSPVFTEIIIFSCKLTVHWKYFIVEGSILIIAHAQYNVNKIGWTLASRPDGWQINFKINCSESLFLQLFLSVYNYNKRFSSIFPHICQHSIYKNIMLV